MAVKLGVVSSEDVHRRGIEGVRDDVNRWCDEGEIESFVGIGLVRDRDEYVFKISHYGRSVQEIAGLLEQAKVNLILGSQDE